LARTGTMYRVPQAGPRWPAVAGPVERGVRPRFLRAAGVALRECLADAELLDSVGRCEEAGGLSVFSRTGRRIAGAGRPRRLHGLVRAPSVVPSAQTVASNFIFLFVFFGLSSFLASSVFFRASMAR
jgi:hypothetical protein